MKKMIAMTLAVLLVASSAFGGSNDLFAEWNGAVKPISSSMGNAGLFLDRTENIVRNPSLQGTDWVFQTPGVSLRMHNIENNREVFSALKNGLLNGENIVPLAVGFLNNIPGGFKDFIELDGWMYFGFPYVGLTSDFGFGLLTDGNGDVTSSVVSHVNASFNLSGAWGWEFVDGCRVDIGLGVGARYKMASMSSTGPDGIGVDKVADVMENTRKGFDIPNAINELFRTGINYSTGWSFPVSLGVTFTLPYGFTTGLTVSDINPDYHMFSYNEMDDAWSGDFEGGVKGTPFTLEGKTDFSIGAAWEMDNFLSPYWLRASAAVDFVDIIGFWADRDFMNWAGYVEHVRMGAEVSILTAFDMRVGLDRGFFTAGAGINLWGNRLDFTYGVKPYGKVMYGDSLDYVAVMFTLGWEDYE